MSDDVIRCGNCGHPSPGHRGACWYEIDGPGPGPTPKNPHDIPCPHGDDVGCCLVCTPERRLTRPPVVAHTEGEWPSRKKAT